VISIETGQSSKAPIVSAYRWFLTHYCAASSHFKEKLPYGISAFYRFVRCRARRTNRRDIQYFNFTENEISCKVKCFYLNFYLQNFTAVLFLYLSKSNHTENESKKGYGFTKTDNSNVLRKTFACFRKGICTCSTCFTLNICRNCHCKA